MGKTTVNTPDGPVVVNHPDGVSDDEIIAWAKKQRAQALQAAPDITPKLVNPQQREWSAAMQNAPDSRMGQLAVHAGRGVQNVMDYVGGKFDNPEQGQARRNRRAYQEDPVYKPLAARDPEMAELGQTLGEMGSTMAIPGGPARLMPRAAGLGASVARTGAKYAPDALVGAGSAEMTGGDPSVGALAGPAARKGMETLGKYSAAKGQRFERPEDQEMVDIARRENIVTSSGFVKDQQEAARSAAARRLQGGTQPEIADQLMARQTGRLDAHRTQAEMDYEQLIDVAGDTPVDLDRVRSRVGEALEIERGYGLQGDSGLMKEYRKWTETPDSSLKDLQAFRTRLRAKIGETKNTDQARRLVELEKGITEDMTAALDMLAPGENLGGALKRVDSWYHENVGNLERMPGMPSMKKDASPKALLNWWKNATPDQIARSWNVLDDEGRRILKESMYEDAFSAAAKGEGKFNPQTYANRLRKFQSNLDEIDPGSAQELGGLIKIMDHIAGEGKAPGAHWLKVIRGFPFIYRSITDRMLNSSFRYNWQRAANEVIPDRMGGSAAMGELVTNASRFLTSSERDMAESTAHNTGLDRAPGMALEGLSGLYETIGESF